MSGKATAAKAQEAAESATITVEIPEWGGEVTVRRAMLADVTWTRSQIDLSDFDFDEYQLHLLSRCITSPEVPVDILRAQPIGVLSKLLTAMNQVSGVASPEGFRPDDD